MIDGGWICNDLGGLYTLRTVENVTMRVERLHFIITFSHFPTLAGELSLSCKRDGKVFMTMCVESLHFIVTSSHFPSRRRAFFVLQARRQSVYDDVC